MHRLAALTALAIVVAACGRPQEAAREDPVGMMDIPSAAQRAAAAPIQPLPQKKFGAEITVKTSVPLEQIARAPRKYMEGAVRTEGVVFAVCKSMGCWMEVADSENTAHIKMAGHSFFVPKTASGHRAVIQGKVVRAAPDGDDCAQEAKEQTGQVAKVEIEATGVEFVD